MKFSILTLFPDIIEAYFSQSIMAKAVERGLITYQIVNIRDFALDNHKTCDDAPYGGGAGMVLKPEPLAAALDSVEALSHYTVYPSPGGRLFSQACAQELKAKQEMVFICGRYEGIDQRIIDTYVDEEICIGDYVLSSGEIAALAIIDAVYRLCEGVIKKESLTNESFNDSLLEYPQYTRPEIFRGLEVPEVLKSGHHEKIRIWRLQESIRKTFLKRPDLLSKDTLNPEAIKIWDQIKNKGECYELD